MNDRGVGGHERPQPIDHAEPRRGMRIDARAALDQKRRQRGIDRVEHAEPAGPPAAAGVDVGAGREQQIDHVAVVRRSNNSRRIEGEPIQRPVQRRHQLRLVAQELSGSLNVIRSNCGGQGALG